jgi:hypothetical protein
VVAEDKYAIALGVVCVVLLAVGALGARRLATASPRIVRLVFPIVALSTFAVFAAFVLIARANAH